MRQAGGMSLSRIFQAGHEATSSQPETVYRVFRRALFDRDVATGEQTVTVGDQDYQITRPAAVRNVTQVLPPMPPLDCDLCVVEATCSENQQAALAAGAADFVNCRVISPAQ